MFGGGLFPPSELAGLRNTAALIGLSLAARVGAFDPTMPDSGQLVTGVPGPGQIGIPPTWGRGRNNWRFDDIFTLDVTVNASGDAAPVGGANAGPDIYVVTVDPTPDGNLVWNFHNRGASPSGDLFIKLRCDHSLVR